MQNANNFINFRHKNVDQKCSAQFSGVIFFEDSTKTELFCTKENTVLMKSYLDGFHSKILSVVSLFPVSVIMSMSVIFKWLALNVVGCFD